MAEQENQVLFCIDPAPTFWAPVEIPMHGGKVGKIDVEYVFKDRDEYAAFFKEHDGKADIEALPQLIRNWKGPDAPYSAETLGRMLRNYPNSGAALVAAYRDYLWGAAEKN